MQFFLSQKPAALGYLQMRILFVAIKNNKNKPFNYSIIGLQIKAIANNRLPLPIIWTLFGLNRVIKD